MSIIERALELLKNNTCIGLGSGRAARAFVHALGKRLVESKLHIRGVATSSETDTIAREAGVPLVSLEEAGILDVTVDGADEVDPDLNLIKGYGRALVREKIVAASSKKLVILVGQEKLVQKLGTRKRLPIEILPFAMPLCRRRLEEMGLLGVVYEDTGKPVVTDNGNHILDCVISPLDEPYCLEQTIRAIPGVVGTGLFLKMADTVLIGKNDTFELIEERHA